MSTDNSPSAILSKQTTFKRRMTSHKIKQINAPLRFTKLVFVSLFKVIIASTSFKTNIAYTFTNKTIQLSSKTGKIKSP